MVFDVIVARATLCGRVYVRQWLGQWQLLCGFTLAVRLGLLFLLVQVMVSPRGSGYGSCLGGSAVVLWLGIRPFCLCAVGARCLGASALGRLLSFGVMLVLVVSLSSGNCNFLSSFAAVLQFGLCRLL